MDEIQSWFTGVDWASQKHDVWLTDASGKRLGKRTFAHSGVGLAQMCDWLIATSGGKPEDIHVAIEVPHGAVVETLLDRGFKVYSINPRQLDRFRDRFSPAGAKDDSRDAETLSCAACVKQGPSQYFRARQGAQDVEIDRLTEEDLLRGLAQTIATDSEIRERKRNENLSRYLRPHED